MKDLRKQMTAALLAATMLSSFCLGGCTKTVEETETSEDTEVTTEETTEDTTEATTEETTEEPTAQTEPLPDPLENLAQYEGMTAEEICATLTLEQKAAQMVHGKITLVSLDDMEEYCYGSILSHFDDWPNLDQATWYDLINTYQLAALQSDACIPYMYGQDSVHGVNFCSEGVIFPHNINIGAAHDPELTEEYGRIVGSEQIAVGFLWNYAPCVACAQDPRWGRTYESYSSDANRTDEMALAFFSGLQQEGVVACAKHFMGDGYTVYGTGENSDGTNRIIDRGDAQMTQEQIDNELMIYGDLIDAGIQTIMISHSSMDGLKMHENAEYIMYLKEELGFEGFIVSDWDSIEKCSGETLKDNVILAINSGIDMLMEATNFEECRQLIVEAVEEGSISEERINDAVTRIIQVKLDAGLFEDPFLENRDTYVDFNSDRSREVARELAAESFVPLKLGDNYTIEPGMRVYVTGPAADDTGVLLGGWTYLWQGLADSDLGREFCPQATTILEGLEAAGEELGFEVVTDPDEADTCDICILCVGEYPYAEWNGDAVDLSITGDLGLDGNLSAINEAADLDIPTLTLVISGRNVIVEDYIDEWDSCIFCYLPGSEGGNAIADVLTGAVEMTGTLPMPYYASVDDIESGTPLYDVGYSALG